jgi:hypothetical protein
MVDESGIITLTDEQVPVNRSGDPQIKDRIRMSVYTGVT